jgi:hypothetical protein
MISSNMDIIGLLPASGSASRFRGLPKFLLPISANGMTLLEWHIQKLSRICHSIVIPINPVFQDLVKSLSLPKHVVIEPLSTSTMSETVLQSLSERSFDACYLRMPDTFIVGDADSIDGNSFAKNSFCSLEVFPTRPDQVGKLGSVALDHSSMVTSIRDKDPSSPLLAHWGAMLFRPKFLSFVENSDAHVGFGARRALSEGQNIFGIWHPRADYFDCGTFEEYLRLIARLGSNPSEI